MSRRRGLIAVVALLVIFFIFAVGSRIFRGPEDLGPAHLDQFNHPAVDSN